MENKVHLWIGTSNLEEADYLECFKLEYSTEGDFEDPSYEKEVVLEKIH